MSRAKFSINKVSYIGRFLSLAILLPLAALSGVTLLLCFVFDSIDKLTDWLFYATLEKMKDIFPFKEE